MCGICGKIYLDPNRPADRALVERMTDVLQHRGPDDHGIFVQGNVGLGHRRLSIIDLSPAGHQPMCNEDGTVWIVYNGEVYNFEALRRDLESRGHVFKSRTDTEAIVHLYEDYGTDCVRHLRGMFAFAIWDCRQRQLVLARDRAGQKPLAYAKTNEAFVFGSEIKALLQDPAIETGVSPEALHHYLTYQYVPGPLTVFNEIKKLPPAHTLVLRDGRADLQCYWKLSYVPGRRFSRESECAEALNDLFSEAVRIRMRSDVPLGAFLSGGIDSSATVAVMSKLSGRPVRTFSIGFEDAEFNELSYARAVAEQCRTQHTEFVVKPDAIRVLPEIVRCYDEPYADPSAIPTYHVSRLTREHVTVALNGDGGDESFAGYERYAADRLAGLYAGVPAFLREGVIRKAVGLLPYRERRWSIIRRLKRFVNGARGDAARRYVQWLCYFSNQMKSELYSADFCRQTAGMDSVDQMAEVMGRAGTRDALNRVLFADVMMYLPYDLLVKVDIASMAHSLEARSPFLDHKLMEFAASLPASLKLRGLQTKYILKKAFEPLLPKEILHRKKMGFGVPLVRWFQQELKNAAYDILLDRRSTDRGYFRPEEIRRLLDEHAARRADHSYRLWALLYLELWFRIFVDKSETIGI